MSSRDIGDREGSAFARVCLGSRGALRVCVLVTTQVPACVTSVQR